MPRPNQREALHRRAAADLPSERLAVQVGGVQGLPSDVEREELCPAKRGVAGGVPVEVRVEGEEL